MNYVATTSGFPCWYELGAADLDAACAFYTAVVGWTVTPADMPGMDYRILNAPDGHMVAGLMEQPAGSPPAWMFYLEVGNCEAFAKIVTKTGGQVIVPPTDVPGTGQFAMFVDPQGAAFGALQPDPVDGQAPDPEAYSTERSGHGAWVELRTSDPEAALAFYSGLVGWTKGQPMSTPDGDTYQLFAAKGSDIGGIQPLGNHRDPAWLVYFSVASVKAATEQILAHGGTIKEDPTEVPGASYIVVGTDPEGARFALIGPLE